MQTLLLHTYDYVAQFLSIPLSFLTHLITNMYVQIPEILI